MTPRLTIEPLWPRSGTSVLRMSGELDLAGVGEASAAVALAEMAGARTLVLDLRALALIDSIGLRFLLETGERARADGRHLVVAANPDGVVRRLLDLTLLSEKLTVVADPEATVGSDLAPER